MLTRRSAISIAFVAPACAGLSRLLVYAPGQLYRAEGREERPNRSAPSTKQRKAMIGSLKQSSALRRKGKDPIAAGRVGELEGSEPPTLFFYFPRAGDPIALSDKESTFITRIGPLQLKVKFGLKVMQYRAQLSL